MVSDYDVDEVRKAVGLDEHGCLCCDVSNCCGELPSALDELERLTIILDNIHSLAVSQWSEGSADGWLKVMQLADPGVVEEV